MTTTIANLLPLECVIGTQPPTDQTPLATQHYSFSQNIRYFEGKPQKIGGWNQQSFDNNASISGVVRSIFSTVFSNRTQTLIGSNEKLYNISGSVLTNITPLTVDTIAIANSLATHYATLAANPVSVTIGSSVVRVFDSEADKLQVGDTVTVSGATTTGGVPNTELNADHFIRLIGSGYYEFNVTTLATSTTTGGGASVVRSSGLITVTDAAHGQENGDRVKIIGAVDAGGIIAADINKEFILRNKTTNTFDVMTDGTASSSVTGAGGGATEYSQEIPIGNVNERYGQGYGMGLYGVGLYGTALLSDAGRSFPRIWFFDKYGDLIIANPGNQTGVYSWDGSTSEAPALVENAPTEVNYAFISDNILVTFGAGDIPNKIFSSDQGDITQWSASSLNAVYENNIQSAGRLVSHANVNGINVIFTEQRSYTMRFVGINSGVWSIKPLEPIGIIAPMARVSVNGVVIWMGLNNFYMWRGGSVEILPSNSQEDSTLLNYVFDDLNFGQKSKIFAWYNSLFQEVWFHYPSSTSNEPDRVAVVNVKDFTWYPLQMGRTAAEYPEINLSVPRLATPSSLIYRHESGTDDVNSPLSWSLTFNKRYQQTKKSRNIMAFIPDSSQTGNITVNVQSWLYPQSQNAMYDQDYTITPTTERVSSTINGKIYQYNFSGSELGQTWQMGAWSEEVQEIQGGSSP